MPAPPSRPASRRPASLTALVGKPLTELERLFIAETLRLTAGNREEAAKMLGIGERTLYRKIKEYRAVNIPVQRRKQVYRVREHVYLPKAYLAYMQSGRPVEGELSVDPGRFQLWPVDQLDELNQGYRVAECLPGFRGFGSNGGGEFLAFDSENRVVMVPFIPMDEKGAQLVAESWADFEATILA